MMLVRAPSLQPGEVVPAIGLGDGLALLAMIGEPIAGRAGDAE
jgi:hypothetical protein